MGGNAVIHRFLCAYIVAVTDHPDFFRNVEVCLLYHIYTMCYCSTPQLNLYLVPVGSNKLATFLARTDKWYRRHVYDSFKGPLGICPQVSESV
jgi:hypothetical protein